MKKLISICECSKISGLGRDTLYRLVRSNQDLPFTITVGKITRINQDLFFKWLDKQTINGGKL